MSFHKKWQLDRYRNCHDCTLRDKHDMASNFLEVDASSSSSSSAHIIPLLGKCLSRFGSLFQFFLSLVNLVQAVVPTVANCLISPLTRGLPLSLAPYKVCHSVVSLLHLSSVILRNVQPISTYFFLLFLAKSRCILCQKW